jgi:hypothetical protein
MRRSKVAATAPIAGITGAMVFAGALAAAWVQQRLTRTVGDVAVGETQATTGMELVPLGVVAGLTAVVCGISVLITRGVARRVAAVLLVVSGAGAVTAVALGVVRAIGLDGRITAAPWIAGPAAGVVVAAGLLAWGPTARRMPARYDVDAPAEDREWQMAADPGDTQASGQTGELG